MVQPEGGFHEEGGSYGTTGEREHVVHAEPGKANMLDGPPGGKATVNTTKPASPELVPDDYKITGTFHVHPKGTRPAGNGMMRAFAQPISEKDLSVAKNSTASKGSGNHYVLGARSGKVYIYNSSGQLSTFPLAKFTEIGIKK